MQWSIGGRILRSGNGAAAVGWWWAGPGGLVGWSAGQLAGSDVPSGRPPAAILVPCFPRSRGPMRSDPIRIQPRHDSDVVHVYLWLVHPYLYNTHFVLLFVSSSSITCPATTRLPAPKMLKFRSNDLLTVLAVLLLAPGNKYATLVGAAGSESGARLRWRLRR